MGLIVILSAVAGGVCGLLDGYERKPRPEPEREVPPGAIAHIDAAQEKLSDLRGVLEDQRQLVDDARRVFGLSSDERHRRAVDAQRDRYITDLKHSTDAERLTATWIRFEWAKGRLVPETALNCPEVFASYLTQLNNGFIRVAPPWDQYDTNQRSIA